MSQNSTGNSNLQQIKKRNTAFIVSDAAAEGEHHTISVLSTHRPFNERAGHKLGRIYLMHKGELILGPFREGGVCASQLEKGLRTTVAKNETQVVPDVHKFPTYCPDGASNSEIVCP